MRRELIYFVCLCFILTGATRVNAQVSIGGDSPQIPQPFSILELISAPTTTVGGLRLPQLTEADKTSINSKLVGNEKSKGLFIYNSDKSAIEYWDGTRWITLSSGGNITQPWQVAGTAVSSDSVSVSDTIYHTGSVAIGMNAKTDPTAILDIQATDRGILLPRVTLSSSTDQTTILNPAIGLLVYNTGTNPNFAVQGYMFWSGSEWKIFSSMTANPARATLNCAGTQMAPTQQVIGNKDLIIGTMLQVPYSLSNGGSFNGATLTSTGNPNVTASISGGILSTGNGVLNFSLEGTPTIGQQAPNGITFDLKPFLDVNPDITGCNSVTVGDILTASITSTAVMGYLTRGIDEDGIQNWSLVCKSPDGKFSARVQVPNGVTSVAIGNQEININVRNNTSSPVPVIFNYSTTWSGGLAEAANSFTMPAQHWGGAPDPGTTWINTAANSNAGYWGNIGVYDGTGPEYRRYTWIPIGGGNRVSYEITAMCAIDTSLPGTGPDRIEVYIKFEQVTAAQ